MARLDFVCTKCQEVEKDCTVSGGNVSRLCRSCGSDMEVLWTTTRVSQAAVHPSERSVVWENPITGEVKYPGRNDIPIPDRYSKQGFVRRELTSLRDIHQFEKEHNVRSEIAWFDRGSGRGFDDRYEKPPMKPRVW